MTNEGTQVPHKDFTFKDVMDKIASHLKRVKALGQGKEDSSSELQGTIAKLSTFNISNERSVSDSLSICELNDSLPCVDNVYVERVGTLVDPVRSTCVHLVLTLMT